MRDITADTGLVACCGLYCGACGKYLKETCDGCAKNAKATWCKVRSCCQGKGIASCADCKEFADVSKCKKFNNVFSKLFGLVFGSDRKACVDLIGKEGYGDYAKLMAADRAHSIKK
jgi:hypothetical protein